MNIVILAGGYGTRLHEKTNKIPKPMVNIGRKPILLHIVDYFLKFNCENFIVCTGYKSSYISTYLENNFKKLTKVVEIFNNFRYDFFSKKNHGKKNNIHINSCSNVSFWFSSKG